MGEWIPASIKVGGRIRREVAKELVDQLNSWNLTCGHDGDAVTIGNLPTAVTFRSSSINYGNLDELTDWCDQHDLDWEHWCDSGPDWSPMIKRRVGGAYDMMVCDNDDNPMIPIADLIKLDALATGWADLHARIKAWAVPVPKLEIVP